MSVTAKSAAPALPWMSDYSIITGYATGTISVGDWLAFSGSKVVNTNSGHTAYWKASGAGVALDASPVYDSYGRTAQNTAMRILRQGVLRVTGAQSGTPTLGLGAFPVSTGSAVGYPTGVTGVGATWTALAPVAHSSNPTATIASPVGYIIGADLVGGQSAQLDVLLVPNFMAGYYG